MAWHAGPLPRCVCGQPTLRGCRRCASFVPRRAWLQQPAPASSVCLGRLRATWSAGTCLCRQASRCSTLHLHAHSPHPVCVFLLVSRGLPTWLWTVFSVPIECWAAWLTAALWGIHAPIVDTAFGCRASPALFSRGTGSTYAVRRMRRWPFGCRLLLGVRESGGLGYVLLAPPVPSHTRRELPRVPRLVWRQMHVWCICMAHG